MGGEGQREKERQRDGRDGDVPCIKNHTCPVASAYTESLNSASQIQVGGQFSKNADTGTYTAHCTQF